MRTTSNERKLATRKRKRAEQEARQIPNEVGQEGI